MHYWKVDNPQHYSTDNFPVFYHAAEPGDSSQPIYGISIYEFPELLKVSLCNKYYVLMCDHTHTYTHCWMVIVVHEMRDQIRDVSNILEILPVILFCTAHWIDTLFSLSSLYNYSHERVEPYEYC